jgi:hypothetical protein
VTVGPSQWASWTTQYAAAGVVAGDELRREVTRILTATPARGARAVGRRLDRWASIGIPWAFDAVLSRVDLTEVVIKRVDLDRVVADVDLDAAIRRVDLLGLAQYIIDGVNLPAIVRDSSASFTTEAVHGLRVHGVEADKAVSRVVGHLIPRRRTPDADVRRAPQAQPEPLG